jgi:hypothetical protein
MRIGRRFLVPRRALERVLGYEQPESPDDASQPVKPLVELPPIPRAGPTVVIELRIVVDIRTGEVSSERPSVVSGQDCS